MIGAAAVVAGTGYTIYSTEEAKDEAEDLANKQAASETEAAKSEAARIRERAQRMKGAQSAALAASGVKLSSSGTSGALLQETDRLAEQDALAVLQGGKARSSAILDQGKLDANAYRSRSISSAINGASELTSMAASRARATEAGRTASTVKQTTAKKYSLLGDT